MKSYEWQKPVAEYNLFKEFNSLTENKDNG